MQLFNIGAEGQLYLGAVGASWIALQLGDRDVTSTPLFVVAMCAAAAVARRAVGADPGCPSGVRADERDHHVADAQLRRGPAPHVPDLRQLVVLARHVDPAGSGVPAGEADAGRFATGRPSGRRSSCRSAFSSGSSLAVVVWVLYSRMRFGFEVGVIARLAARRAVCGDADAPEDPRGDGSVRGDRGHRRRESDRRLHAHARRQPDGPAGGGVRVHGHRRRGSGPLQPVRGLPRRGAHRRASERRATRCRARLPVRARGRDAGDHPLLRARRASCCSATACGSRGCAPESRLPRRES